MQKSRLFAMPLATPVVSLAAPAQTDPEPRALLEASSSGTASLAPAIPDTTTLMGLPILHRFRCRDAAANPAGWTWSNAGRDRYGSQ